MRRILFLLLTLSLFISCENSTKEESGNSANGKLKVFAVNYPLYYFADRIAGEMIELVYPIPSDVDPAYWIPEDDLDLIQNMDVILDNGADYAKWMEKVSLPSSKILNTSRAFENQYIRIQQGESHSHGAGGEHVHYGYAFTTWLDFKIAAGQAEAIKDILIKKIPQSKEVIEGNFAGLKADLLSLDEMMEEVTGKLPEIAVFTSHPVYQYLGRAYGLELVSEHWEPGETPSEKQWHEFEHNLEHHPSSLMLWEGEPNDETEEKLKGLKVNSVLFSPCSNKPEAGDFLSIMRKNIERLKKYVDEFC